MSRAASTGNAFGQALGVWLANRLQQGQREQRQQEFIESTNPLRQAVSGQLRQQGALPTGDQPTPLLPGTSPAAGIEGAVPGLPEQARPPTGQGTMPQQMLARIQQDPETFARLFAEQGVEGITEMMQQPEAPEQFTLSPGQTRFQGSQPIATVPERQEVDPSSAIAKLRQDLNGGFITREEFDAERSRLLATDEPVIAVADSESSTGQRFVPRSEAAGMEAPGGSDSVREQRIRDTMDQYQLGRDEAVAIVDGLKRIEIVPETGRARLIDERDNSVREIPIGDGAQPGQAQPGQAQPGQAQPTTPEFQMPEGGTLWDMAGTVTGPGAAFRRFVSVPSGLMGLPVAEQTTRATQAFNQSAQELTRALAINPRFPVGEMNRIREEIATLPQFWDNEKLLRIRMAELDRGLRRRAEQARQNANDTSLPDDVRNAQASNANAIEAFLPVLGAPQAPEGIPPGSVRTGERTRSGGVVWEDPDGEKWIVE